MSKFRLFKAIFQEKNFETNEINFINPNHNTDSNYISLIIGNNGTGKSRILSKIVKHFVYKSEKTKGKALFGTMLEYNRLPEKIIAITNSISDKFPTDESFRSSQNLNKNRLYRDFKYNYLGTRNKVYSFSNRALMNRALDILFENYSEIDVSRNYRHVFEYLDYEPIIKLNYKISSSIYKFANDKITPNILYEYLEDKKNESNFRRFNKERLKDLIDNRINDLCTFLNSNHIKNGELLINFSEKNISRIIVDNSMYEDNVLSYNLIGILKKIGIIRNLEIKVYKKGGFEFNFNDASSGEANILSTLIALIPIIQDNSLVLIDEPEISLHPLWQSKYISLINKIFSNFSGCHILIASHSHFLVTNLQPGKSSIITLNNKKGQIIAETLKEPTYGWSAEEILYNVFKVKTVRNYFIESDLVDLLGLISERSNNIEKIRQLLNSIKSLNISSNDPLNAVIEEANAYLKDND